MNEESGIIKFYATEWCTDCRRALYFLKKNEIPFDYINIDQDPEGEAWVIKTNHGNRSVPTILFPDGSILVEPSNEDLAEKLDL